MELIINKLLDQALAKGEPHWKSRLIYGSRRDRLDPWRNLLVDSWRDTNVKILCGTLEDPTTKFNILGKIGTPPNRLQLPDELEHEAARIFYGENTWIVDDFQDLKEFAAFVGPKHGHYVHTLVLQEVFKNDSTDRDASSLTHRQRLMIDTLRNHFTKVKNIQFRLKFWEDYTTYENKVFLTQLAMLDSVTHISILRPEACPNYALKYAEEETEYMNMLHIRYLAYKTGAMELDTPLHSPSISQYQSSASFISDDKRSEGDDLPGRRNTL